MSVSVCVRVRRAPWESGSGMSTRARSLFWDIAALVTLLFLRFLQATLCRARFRACRVGRHDDADMRFGANIRGTFSERGSLDASDIRSCPRSARLVLGAGPCRACSSLLPPGDDCSASSFNATRTRFIRPKINKINVVLEVKHGN